MAEFTEDCVTIVIPTKDREDKLLDTLVSLTTNYPKSQIIVVNDGAPLKNFSEFAKFSKVTFTKNLLHPGEAGAVNTAWQIIKTELVAVVSDDDPQGPDWLPELLRAVTNNPNFGVYYPTTVIKESGKVDKKIIAQPFDRNKFYRFLKCPCLAGVLINYKLLRPRVAYLRVSGQTYPNDLIQWLSLSLVCDFKGVPQSEAFWWVHPEQFSQKIPISILYKSYISNVGAWYLQELPNINMSPMIIYLRSLQLAMSRGFHFTNLKEVTLDFYAFSKQLKNSYLKLIFQLLPLTVQLFWLKFKND
jgi:glycosyltransferase involved in cell wall biosynthesis